MLKLEKIAKTLEISITLRQRESLFNKTFIQALMIAIGLHLFAGILFNVRFIKIAGSQTVIPPAFVEADLTAPSDNSIVAIAEEEENHPKHFIEAKGSKPQLPAIPLSEHAQQTVQLQKACCWKKNPFIEIEAYANPAPIPLPKAPNTPGQPIQVYVSGGLNAASLMQEGWESIDPATLKTQATQNYCVIFAVRIDGQTGSVFWYEFKTDRAHKELDALAEQILKNMRFDKSEDSFATLGEVEIVFKHD